MKSSRFGNRGDVTVMIFLSISLDNIIFLVLYFLLWCSSQILINVFERPFFQGVYSDVINKDANGKDGKYASNGIKTRVREVICSFAIHHLLPQPISHGIAIGVNEQNAECTSCNGINPLVMFHLQVLEIHEC